MVYRGSNKNVNVETLYTCDTGAVNETVSTMLYVNNIAVNEDYTGGRGYLPSTQVLIYGPPGSKNATARANVSNGNITSITVVNRGTGYTSATVEIKGSGIEAFATATVNGSQGIDTITLTPVKMMASGVPGLLSTQINKKNTVIRDYNIQIVGGDVLTMKSSTTDAQAAPVSKVYTARLQITEPQIQYI